TVQAIIDEKKHDVKFFLTGSSARKLRRGQANFLPGRIHMFFMTPLVASELNFELNTDRALATGTLPGIYSEDDEYDRQKTLESYSAIYLQEEIKSEALTRNIEGFTRFLQISAVTSTQFLDFNKLANEAQINPQTARRYFEILQDTLIVHSLDAFAKSNRKRLVQHPRYFFFDNGVLNALLGNFYATADRKGMLFENLFCTQVRHSLDSRDIKGYRLSSYRTEHGAEVDLIVEQPDGKIWAIELKSSANVGKSDLTGLKSFSKFIGKKHRSIVAYLGQKPQLIEDVEILPWQTCLKEMNL
ncbi:MAG: DUF4143 domain-containing protein, partial [Oligoflexales bacterium]|nr:DUF4143 domain-containing protein [Oligoflexales bacterium]